MTLPVERFEQGPDGGTISPLTTEITGIGFARESNDWDSDSDAMFTSSQKHSGNYSATAERFSIEELVIPFGDDLVAKADLAWSFWWRYTGYRLDMANAMVMAWMGKADLSSWQNWNEAPSELRNAWRIGTVLVGGQLTFSLRSWKEVEEHYFTLPKETWLRWGISYRESDSSWAIEITGEGGNVYFSKRVAGFHVDPNGVEVSNGPAFLSLQLFDTGAGSSYFQTWVDDINFDPAPTNIAAGVLTTRQRFGRA